MDPAVKIAVIVVVAIPVLMIVFRGIVGLIADIVIARGGSQRMQHYAFAHVVLPYELFLSTDSIIFPLIKLDSSQNPDGRDFLVSLWDLAGKPAGYGVVPPDGLDYTIEVFSHPNSTAFLIQLPMPMKKPEAYFAAIVCDLPGLATGKPRQLRYFVLEYHGEKNGAPKTLLGEWMRARNGGLKYAAHGSNTPPDMASFQRKVQEIIAASDSMPEPFHA